MRKLHRLSWRTGNAGVLYGFDRLVDAVLRLGRELVDLHLDRLLLHVHQRRRRLFGACQRVWAVVHERELHLVLRHRLLLHRSHDRTGMLGQPRSSGDSQAMARIAVPALALIGAAAAGAAARTWSGVATPGLLALSVIAGTASAWSP